MSCQVKADGSKVCIYSDTRRVGQNISTKSVGSNKRMNITDSYKYKEGRFVHAKLTYVCVCVALETK